MKNKPPAFQLYVNDWLGSAKIMLMSPAEEGAYIRLLCIAWGQADCGLPDDDEQLSILSRLGEAWGKGASEKIRECFYEQDGRLYNDVLLRQRKSSDSWLKGSSKGGKRSAERRAKERKQWQLDIRKAASSGLGGSLQGGLNTSTSPSSSTSSSIKEKNKRREPVRDKKSLQYHEGLDSYSFRCFTAWWGVYPKREAKNKAFEAYLKAMKVIQPEALQDGAWRYVDHMNGKERRFIKLPATWLNQGCWDDVYEPDPPEATKPATMHTLTQKRDALKEKINSMSATYSLDQAWGREKNPQEFRVVKGLRDEVKAVLGQIATFNT